MDCLSSFASAFAKDLVCGAANQLRYPCCFNNFVEDLQREEDKLIATRKNVDDRVKHAKKQVIKNDEVFNAWLEKSSPLKDNVEDLLKKARTSRSCCFGHCPNWIWKYRLARKLAKKKREVEICIEEGIKYIQFERIASLPSIQHLPSEKCLKFGSRQYAYEQLMEALKDDEVTIIGLYGMGGCGKTTIAMELMRIAKVEHLFDKVLFVPVSSKVEVRMIQDKIASALQFQFPEEGERERAQRLCMRLNLDDERTLVILDDVWQLLDFGDIGIPLDEDHKNCKVLITTRSETICSLMDCQRMICLSTLTDEEAWALFQNQAHVFEGTSNNLKHLGRLISNECKGLPVAIAALANTLKGKAEDDWNVALNRLRSSIPVNIEKGLKNPYNCLQVSYDNLDNEEAKSLFLLCSMFPEDYEIPIEILIRFAIGLGLVGEVRSYEEARNEVSAAKNKLISSCLLSSARGGICVKMHDLVRDVALWIASNDNKLIKCILQKDVTLECSSIRYLLCKEFPNELDCSSIELLCLETNLEVSDEIFKTMGRLRVLLLWWEGRRSRSLLTMSFKSLANIRCLFLKRWELGDISSIGYMTKLESLTLHCCSFIELSDAIITNLTNLRLLHLSECDMKRNPFEVIGKHPLLEELYIGAARFEWDFGSGDHAKFFKKFSVPQALRRYHIKLGPKFKGHEDKILSHHRTLILSCFDISNAAVVVLAKKAEVLLVANIVGGAKNIIPDIFQTEEGGVMNYTWIQLWLCDSEEIKCLVDTSNHSQEVETIFPKLCKLRIERMKHLGALYHGVPPNVLFEKLEELYISECPVKTCLFTPIVARSLVQLKKLEIFSCDELKHVLEDDNTENAEISREDNRLVFSKLKRLHIMGCLMLEYIIPITFAQGLVQLESLDIDYCSELKYVFGQCTRRDQIQNELKIKFPALEVLRLTDNCNMISIFPQYCYAKWPSLHKFYLEYCPKFDIMSVNTFKTSRKKLRDVKAIEKHFLSWEIICIHNSKVETIFSLNGLETIGQPVSLQLQHLELSGLYQMKHICIGLKNSFSFQNLKTLEIKKCKKLEVILPASVLKCMPDLKHLEIIKCQELKQIIEEDIENQKLSNFVSPQPCFPKLSKLIIKHCHNLKRLFCASTSNDLPNLEVLIIQGSSKRSSKLEELIGYEEGQGDEIRKVKVELPKLKLLMLAYLSSLCQGIELPITLRVVHDCPKLSLTSSPATFEEFESKLSDLDIDLERNGLDQWKIFNIIGEIKIEEESKKKFVGEALDLDISSVATSLNSSKLIELPSTSPLDIPLHKANLHESVDGQSMSELSLTNRQKPFGGTGSMVEIPESIKGGIEEEVTTHNANIVTLSIHSESASLQPGPSVISPYKSYPHSIEYKIKESIQEGSTSDYTMKATLPIGTKDNGLGVMAVTHIETGCSQSQKMQKVDDSIQEGSNLIDKKGEISFVSSGSIEVHPEACADIIVELGAFKQFTNLDDAQIALLAEAITVYPHLWKVVDNFSLPFQAWMLKTLADMLSFLRNDSAASITPQREKEFQKLCNEVIQLGFERSWVDEMRQRVTVRDPRVSHAQTRLNELLERHDQLTQELHKIKDEIDSLNDFVDSHSKCFDFL